MLPSLDLFLLTYSLPQLACHQEQHAAIRSYKVFHQFAKIVSFIAWNNKEVFLALVKSESERELMRSSGCSLPILDSLYSLPPTIDDHHTLAGIVYDTERPESEQEDELAGDDNYLPPGAASSSKAGTSSAAAVVVPGSDSEADDVVDKKPPGTIRLYLSGSPFRLRQLSRSHNVISSSPSVKNPKKRARDEAPPAKAVRSSGPPKVISPLSSLFSFLLTWTLLAGQTGSFSFSGGASDSSFWTGAT